MVEKLRDNSPSHPDIGIAQIFLNYQNSDESAINIFGSILQQLIFSIRHLPLDFKDMHKKHQKHHTRPSLAEIVQCLVETIGCFSKAYIIIDALNEYDEGDGVRDVLLRELLDLVSVPNVQILITSRWLTSIESQLGDCRRLEIRAARGDICKYVEGRISNSSRLLKRVKTDPELQEDIVDTVADACQGM